MNSATSPTGQKQNGKQHWIVATNYKLRVFSLALSFIAIAMEWWGRAGPGAWAGLVLVFLIYPHLAFVQARMSADGQKAEFHNLVADSILLGVVVAALHFPLWLTFSLWLGASMNSAICRGVPGLWRATAGLLAGAAGGVAVFGFAFQPEAGWPSTLLVIAGTAAYLLIISLAVFWHNQQLRAVRRKLRLGEQALNDTNARLEQQLAEVTRLQAQLNEQAVRDPLTGLFNRRYLETIVPHELARCARDGSSMALIMIDIDHFKAVNDRYGHQGGDEVLKALAGLLIDSVRASDVACRFGGEEFLLLLPNMAATGAAERAEEWRTAFAAMAVPSNGEHIRATLSMGVAIHPHDGADLHALVRAADLALYRAKAEGRNRVVFAHTTPALTRA
ncbi:diguanylate cyclase [Massilia sp. PAMC28688]|uniref:sensor domain-containing diguanylate cyclase n=1 Tax=Massilia sp. PAMC28688 TaxID=2861283 RepID=UPI001C6329F7|nr:sensor domain-containing diguanylate cyclase [Massilia sp. PAMC28688]QYF95227.1 diguanylate cyclase [Massilia sp. PAMC28688]